MLEERERGKKVVDIFNKNSYNNHRPIIITMHTHGHR